MAKKPQFDYDLIVIGSGAGGSAAASIVARKGKKVAIVEADTFGGDSPNWSDVPTKALLHVHTYTTKPGMVHALVCVQVLLVTITLPCAPGKTSP